MSTLAKSSHVIVDMQESPAPRCRPQRGTSPESRRATATDVELGAGRPYNTMRGTGVVVIGITRSLSTPNSRFARGFQGFQGDDVRSSLSQRRHDPFVRSRRTRYRTCGAVPCKRGAGVQTMRKTKDRKPSATVITACSAFSAVCVLGAACHFDALLGSGRKGGGSGGGGGGGGRRHGAQPRDDIIKPAPPRGRAHHHAHIRPHLVCPRTPSI